MLSEQLEFLRGTGGARAAAYFGLKLAIRIETFHVLWTTTQPRASQTLPPDWCYVSLREANSLAKLPKNCVTQLATQSGTDPERILARGDSLHLLMQEETLLAQLRIDHGPSCQIDSPPLRLSMRPTDAFMSYLYTWPQARRRGAAAHLIKSAVSDLAHGGIHRAFAHIRATNVPSLAAFKLAGWQPCASLFCSTGGRLIMAPGAANVGLTLRPLVPCAD